MKKLGLYTLLMCIAAFTGCDDNINEACALPQTNEQEPMRETNGYTASFGQSLSGTSLNFKDLTDETVLEIVKATTPSLEEGDTINLVVEVADEETFAAPVILPCTVKDGTASITAGELEDVVKNLYGKAPKERTLHARSNVYVVNGTSAVCVAEKVSLGTFKATPEAPFIDTAYYLIGNMNEWNTENLISFSHSGKDVYEDPVFSLIVEIPADNCYWKIIPQTNVDGGDVYAQGVLGVVTDGDEATEGTLVTDNPQAGKIPAKGWVKITLDMMEYTYKIESLGEISPYLYVPGQHQGWDPLTASYLYSTDMTEYIGYVYMSAGNTFKLTSQKDWKGTNYGYASDTELSTDGGAGNLSVTEDGFYQLKVNLSTLTYTATPTQWGIVGDATVGGWNATTYMTLDNSTSEWTLTTQLVPGEYKFRSGESWTINLGGDIDNLVHDGGNLTVTEEGTYTITLKLGDASHYSATVVKQ